MHLGMFQLSLATIVQYFQDKLTIAFESSCPQCPHFKAKFDIPRTIYKLTYAGENHLHTCLSSKFEITTYDLRSLKL